MEKLFSKSHLKAAKEIFPKKITDDWCNTIWTDEEIYCCKRKEELEFIKNPCQLNYLSKKYHDQSEFINNYINKSSNIKKILSVGSGKAELEFFIAKHNPKVEILCLDNAPYT